MRILSVVHNHSSLHPGGTELIAEALHEHYRSLKGAQAWLLAGLDPGLSEGYAGTSINTLPGRGDIFTFRAPGFSPAAQMRFSPEPLLYELDWLLDELQPNFVHIHHLNHFGIELLALLRRKRPDARIIMTLHDYYLICSNDGLMQHPDGGPCPEMNGGLCNCQANAKAAMKAAQRQTRKLYLQQHLELADRLVAPSKFLRDAFINWGIPKQKIELIRHGWPPAPIKTGKSPDPHRFTLIGNLRRTKGSILALEAFLEAAKASDAPLTLDVWGDALYQPDDVKDRIRELAAASDGAIRLHGRFERKDLPRALDRAAWVLMPSTWWENAPLVIEEALSAGRPVLCSDIGGMAEAVRHGKDGLHVATGDHLAWRDAILETGGNAKRWQQLHGMLRQPRTVSEMAADYLELAETKALAVP
jgi:glycosyltransferase involved in cell wall biosynthesis